MTQLMGRPTKYYPEIISKIDEYLATTGREQTELPSYEGLAIYLGVNPDSLYEWQKKYPDFSETLKKIVARQKKQLMDDGLYGGKDVNAAMAIFLLKVNHGMKDGDNQGLTINGPVQIKIVPERQLPSEDE